MAAHHTMLRTLLMELVPSELAKTAVPRQFVVQTALRCLGLLSWVGSRENSHGDQNCPVADHDGRRALSIESSQMALYLADPYRLATILIDNNREPQCYATRSRETWPHVAARRHL